MARIGLIDVDGRNFPNIALMKISAYYKAQGHQVEFYMPFIEGAFIGALVVAAIAIFAAFVYKIIRIIIDEN